MTWSTALPRASAAAMPSPISRSYSARSGSWLSSALAPGRIAVGAAGRGLINHAIDDKDRWRRLMFLVAPLLIVVLALTAVVVWWLLADGGVRALLHDFGRT